MNSIPDFEGNVFRRSLWVQAELRSMGSNFRVIADKHGWSRVTVAGAMRSPSDPQERAIAAELGITQQELFPERFNSDGSRLHHVRDSRPESASRNVKNIRVA